MKRLIFCALMLALQITVFAAETPVPLTDTELDIAEIVAEIQTAGKPYVKNGYAVFTADKNARHVGIAVDFENFNTIHSFMKKNLRDENYEIKDSVYFYVMRLPKNTSQIDYRLVIDGLWTVDPNNPQTVYSPETSLMLSRFYTNIEREEATETISSGTVRFVYKGKSGESIRLGGNFTNWDSWIYKLVEVSPGTYQLDLPLPPGTYEYAFYTGMTSFPDESNPERCYTNDGKVASLLVVN